jgi:hypothetical protein
VHADRVLRSELDTQLAHRLEERQRLDVADRAADLDDEEVQPLGATQDAALDLVGDVRNHLHRRAQVLAAPLFPDHRRVHLTRGDVVELRHLRRHEALVVAEVEVGLGAVVGDVDLAVLHRVHRARVDIDVRVELHVRDPKATVLHERADRRREQSFAQ